MNSASDVWASTLEILKNRLTPTAIDTWFDDVEVINIEDGKMVLYCPSDFKKAVIEGRFFDAIKSALNDIFSGDFDLQILGEAELDPYLNQDVKAKSYSIMDNSNLTFEKFVVGNSNKFAHAAAMAVAATPAVAYNPLFIYGESGLGKTHLLYAICHEIRKVNPNFRIIYIKGDEFTNELIHAIQTGKNVEFRQKYRSADLFLVDDVQFIAGMVRTHEEFFHTFNTLYEEQCQIVLTCDRPPVEILRLDERLRTRFEWGLIADIQPPDIETRIAIAKKKSQQLGFILPDDVAIYIAENITANVRQLEGAVNKLLAYSDLLNDNIDIASVSRAIKDMFKEKTEFIPTVEIIIQETANYYSLTAEDLRGTGRTRNTALARSVSMYLIRKLTNLSFDDIGKEYRGKNGKGMDHSSVMSAVRKIEERLKETPDFSETIRDITGSINSKI